MKRISGIQWDNDPNVDLQFHILFPEILKDGESFKQGSFSSEIYKGIRFLKIDVCVTSRGNVVLKVEYQSEGLNFFRTYLTFEDWKKSIDIPYKETHRKIAISNRFIDKLKSFNRDDYRCIVFTLRVIEGEYELIDMYVCGDQYNVIYTISKDDR